MNELEPQSGSHRYDDLWWILLNGNRSREAELWLKRLGDQTVVDLGGGQDTVQFQRFLAICGARKYITVDKTHQTKTSYIDSESIIGDMLATLKPWPNDSYSFSLNGINKELIDPGTPYGVELTAQIVRLLHPRGLVFGVGGGGVLHELSRRPELRSLFIPTETGMEGDDDNGYYLIAKKAENT